MLHNNTKSENRIYQSFFLKINNLKIFKYFKTYFPFKKIYSIFGLEQTIKIGF